MKKRGAKHSRVRNLDAIGHAIRAVTVLQQHDQAVQAMNTRMAIDDVVRGVRSNEVWSVVFDMTNLVEELCTDPKIARGAEPFVGLLQSAIVEVMDRHRDIGSVAMRAAEVGLLNEAHALFVDLLGRITYGDVSRAERRITARVQRALAGQYPAARIVEAVR